MYRVSCTMMIRSTAKRSLTFDPGQIQVTTELNRQSVRKFMAVGITDKETFIIISRTLELTDEEDFLGTPNYTDRRKFVFFHPDHEDAAEESEAAYALLGNSTHAS